MQPLPNTEANEFFAKVLILKDVSNFRFENMEHLYVEYSFCDRYGIMMYRLSGGSDVFKKQPKPSWFDKSEYLYNFMYCILTLDNSPLKTIQFLQADIDSMEMNVYEVFNKMNGLRFHVFGKVGDNRTTCFTLPFFSCSHFCVQKLK